MFVDSDHAQDKVSCRSRSGVLIYVKTALVFGAEFVAMKQGIDALLGLRYKLMMMGIPISGPLYIYGDNMSVVHNTFRPESVLRKKSYSVCHLAVCESVAMGKSLVGHIPSKENVADLPPKFLYGHKRRYLVSNILYDIHNDH